MLSKAKLIIMPLLFLTLSFSSYQANASNSDSEDDISGPPLNKSSQLINGDEVSNESDNEADLNLPQLFNDEETDQEENSPLITNPWDVPDNGGEDDYEPMGIDQMIEKMGELITADILNNMKKNFQENYDDDSYTINENSGIPSDLKNVSDIDKYWEDIQKFKNIPHAYDRALEELQKLKHTSPFASEFSDIKNYLKYLTSLPWATKDHVVIDLLKAKETLDAKHSGLDKIKDRIIEDLAVRKRNPNGEPPILCFVGPPGVGKTTLAMAIAEAAGRKFASIRLGGVSDESLIRGFERTYVSSMPGEVIKSLIKAGSNNPLMLLDEIDKLGNSNKGDPAAALLEVLDRSQNHEFKDHYMEIPFDLSDVMFIATANSFDIPGPLRDRMEIIELSSYTHNEKMEIAKNHLIPKVTEKNGLNNGGEVEFGISDEALSLLISGYTAEAGVRNLERCIGSLCRKTVAKIEKGEEKSITFTPQKVKSFLGNPKIKAPQGFKEDRIGATQGLAWTPVGGSLLAIEVGIEPGKGRVTATGNLGKVMEESTKLARFVARKFLNNAGVKTRDLDDILERDIHIHAPEGAVPKDGPSAGVTITTSMVSALTGIPVRKDVAMTGEINLQGDVLPIGGLKEKLIAAYKAKMSLALIPKDNEGDLKDVPEEIKHGMKIMPVEHISEVLDAALVLGTNTLNHVPEEICKGKNDTN